MNTRSLFAPGGIAQGAAAVFQGVGDAFKNYADYSQQREQARLARERLEMDKKRQEAEERNQAAHMAFLEKQMIADEANRQRAAESKEMEDIVRYGTLPEHFKYDEGVDPNDPHAVAYNQFLTNEGRRIKEFESNQALHAEQMAAMREQTKIRANQAQAQTILGSIRGPLAERAAINKQVDTINSRYNSMLQMSSGKPDDIRAANKWRNSAMAQYTPRLRELAGIINPAAQKLAELGDYSIEPISSDVKEAPLYDGGESSSEPPKPSSVFQPKELPKSVASPRTKQDVDTYLRPNVTTSRMGFGRGY